MKISYDDWLKAKGLFLLATEATKKSEDCCRALEALLGVEPDGSSHISDAVWGSRTFDEALKLMGITVDEPPPKALA